jgi:hypothetical protein
MGPTLREAEAAYSSIYELNEQAGQGDQNAQEWLRHYTVLADNFLLRVPICPANRKPAP